jgi:hypothetical protein
MKRFFKVLVFGFYAVCMVSAVSCSKEETFEIYTYSHNEITDPRLLLNEDFNHGIPSSWTVIDADGDGFGWYMTSSVNLNWMTPKWQDCACSPSYIGTVGPLTPDNYLISPKIHIEEGSVLSYQFCATSSESNEHYSVLVGVVANGTFNPYATIFSENASQCDLTTRILSLNEWKGKDVSIAFRHHDCTNQFWLCIDNVKVVR